MATNEAASPNVDVFLNGKEVSDDHFQEYVVERDMYQPDMATIILNNQGDLYSTSESAATVEIKVGDDKQVIFKGEVVGVEPSFKGGEKSRIVIRAMNKLHKLIRIRKSRTFTDKTDQQILSQVCQDAGLTLEWKHEKSITYKHVYQHNQTNLEFLRMRAARMGCLVWCVDSTVYVKQPDLGQASGVTLKVDESSKDAALMSFTPRMSSAGVVSKVTVRGWNAEKKEAITGTYEVKSSKLGGKHAGPGAGSHGGEESHVSDHPVTSKEEADALAKARFMEMSLSYITGEATIKGTQADLDLAKTVKIEANAESTNDPFNGGYLIMGITYRHRTPKQKKSNKDEVAHTVLKLARDAQGPG